MRSPPPRDRVHGTSFKSLGCVCNYIRFLKEMAGGSDATRKPKRSYRSTEKARPASALRHVRQKSLIWLAPRFEPSRIGNEKRTWHSRSVHVSPHLSGSFLQK